MGKKRIEVKERDIPNLEIRVLNRDYKPVGDYSLKNFMKKYGGF